VKKTKQGTKKQVMWKATCPECASEFEEAVGNLNVESDRDGQLARGECPDCKCDMFFYPPQWTATRSSQWDDH
jgi:hypothetical protein